MASEHAREIVRDILEQYDANCMDRAAVVDSGSHKVEDYGDRRAGEAVGSTYAERSLCIFAILGLAHAQGHNTGWWFDPEVGDEWPVVFADLPTGQVTWHVHKSHLDEACLTKSEYRWDGHDVIEKYARLRQWAATCKERERYPCKPDIFEKTYEPVDD